MRFHYTASDQNEKIVEGDADAQSPDEVLMFLAGRGLKPVSIKTYKAGEEALVGQSLFGETIGIADKIFLTKYLSLMLRAGTDLFRAIDILIRDFDKRILKALLIEIRSALEKGQPFYATFAKYPRFFSPVFVNLVKAGEASGNLESVFDNLSTALSKEQDLRNRIRAALVYPAILLCLSILILLLLVTFSLPKIAAVFSGTGYNPPLFSKIVFAVGLFLNSYAAIIFPGLAIAAFMAWFFLFKLEANRRILLRIAARLPVVGKGLKGMALQRFASTLASLIKAGLPIVEAIEITADAAGSEELRASLKRIAREGIAKGLTVGEAFRKEAAFPLVVTNLIAVSEKAGHTEDILKTLADFYESEIDSSVKNLVSFVEPVLLLGIGLMIGGIALAIVVPIYQLVGQI